MFHLNRYKQFILKKKVFILLSFFFLASLIRGIVQLDPDFGWHIRLGQIIRDSGIPQHDPFSYTMAHYPVIAHEWFTDIVLSLLFPVIGRVGLALLFALFSTAAIIIVIRQIKPKEYKWISIPLALTLITLYEFAAIRPQILTWLMLCILLSYLYQNNPLKNWLKIPLLFVIWVNIHGGFAMGIAVLFLYSFAKMVEKRRVIKNYILIPTTSLIATFINPYGFGIWYEIWVTMSDSSLRWSIAEWLPALYMPNFLFWVYFGLSVIMITKFIKKYSIAELAVFYFLTALSLSSMRHIPLWAVMALPLTVKGLGLLTDEAAKVELGVYRFRKLYKYLGILILIFYIPTLAINVIRLNLFKESVNYPVKAAEYLQQNSIKGRIFTLYGWSGYLIWKHPGQRVFIHGMMPSWRDHHYPKESNNALNEYMKLYRGEVSVLKLLDKYNVNVVVLTASGSNELNNNKEWEMVFKDNYSTIYLRKN